MKLAFAVLFGLALAPAIEAQQNCIQDSVCIDPSTVICSTNGFSFCELYAVSTQFDLELQISAYCNLEGDFFSEISAGAGVFVGQGGNKQPCQVPVTGGVDGWYSYGSYWNTDFVQADASGYVPPPFDADQDVYQAEDCLGFQRSSGPGGALPCGVVVNN